jgi:hypothetical protein
MVKQGEKGKREEGEKGDPEKFFPLNNFWQCARKNGGEGRRNQHQTFPLPLLRLIPFSPLNYFRSRAWTSHTMTTRSLLLPDGSLTRSSNTAFTEKPAFLKAVKAPKAWR